MNILIGQWTLSDVQYRHDLSSWELQKAIGKIKIVAECLVYDPKARLEPLAPGQVAPFARGMAMRKYGKQWPVQIRYLRDLVCLQWVSATCAPETWRLWIGQWLWRRPAQPNGTERRDMRFMCLWSHLCRSWEIGVIFWNLLLYFKHLN